MHAVTFERASELVVAMGLCDIEDSSELGVSRFHERMVAIDAFVSSLLIVDDEERVSSTLRQSLSLVGFMEFFESFGISRKTRSTVTKRARRNQRQKTWQHCRSKFLQSRLPDKLDRFLTVYVLPLSLKLILR